jgi:hypothetical protein
VVDAGTSEAQALGSLPIDCQRAATALPGNDTTKFRELSCCGYSNPSELGGRLRCLLADAWG